MDTKEWIMYQDQPHENKRLFNLFYWAIDRELYGFALYALCRALIDYDKYRSAFMVMTAGMD